MYQYLTIGNKTLQNNQSSQKDACLHNKKDPHSCCLTAEFQGLQPDLCTDSEPQVFLHIFCNSAISADC